MLVASCILTYVGISCATLVYVSKWTQKIDPSDNDGYLMESKQSNLVIAQHTCIIYKSCKMYLKVVQM